MDYCSFTDRTSSTESFKLFIHTPLYENEQNERKILQWRLHKQCLQFVLKPSELSDLLTFVTSKLFSINYQKTQAKR